MYSKTLTIEDGAVADGITILNTTAVLTGGWLILGIILALISTVCGLIAVTQFKKLGLWTILLVFISGSSYCLVNMIVDGEFHSHVTEYQVMFDDTVSANAVHELYNIIKIDGKIWTITEKV